MFVSARSLIICCKFADVYSVYLAMSKSRMNVRSYPNGYNTKVMYTVHISHMVDISLLKLTQRIMRFPLHSFAVSPNCKLCFSH